ASPRDLVTLLDRLAGDELSDRGRDLAIDETVVLLGTDHTVSGNPMRFRSGAVAVRADDRWRTEMPSLARVFVSVVTTPLRQVYSR
ncbi:MAG: sulfotransferase, partial [Rhodococcus sp.]|nr:sulfotransferase [Rhodococcus sp. (in: high G+C Gram-positive bacteria)]